MVDRCARWIGWWLAYVRYAFVGRGCGFPGYVQVKLKMAHGAPCICHLFSFFISGKFDVAFISIYSPPTMRLFPSPPAQVVAFVLVAAPLVAGFSLSPSPVSSVGVTGAIRSSPAPLFGDARGMVATNAEAEAVAAAEAEAEMGQKRKKTKEVSYAFAGRRNMCAAVCTLVLSSLFSLSLSVLHSCMHA